MALLTRGLGACPRLPARLARGAFRAPSTPLARSATYAAMDGPEQGGSSARVYTSYDVFKGKSAMNVKVIPPTFGQMGGGALTLKKAGALLLECAPGASRQYDWSKKLAMALSVNEIAEILAFTAEANASLEFVHDPNMGGPNAGMTVKQLRVSAMPDGKGLFVYMSQRDKGGASVQLSVPVTWGEFAALRTLIEFSIPRLLGWDRALAEATVVPQQ